MIKLLRNEYDRLARLEEDIGFAFTETPLVDGVLRDGVRQNEQG